MQDTQLVEWTKLLGEDVSDASKLDGFISKYASSMHIRAGYSNWPVARKVVAAKQIACELGLKKYKSPYSVGEIDGLIGPKTSAGFNEYARLLKNVVVEPKPITDSVLDTTKYTINAKLRAALPTQADCTKFYGKPTTNIISVKIPYKFRLAWDLGTTVSTIQCNSKVSKDIQGIFETILSHYGLDAIKELNLDIYGGAYANRSMVNSSKLSMHAYGIAIDMDPDRNGYKQTWKEAEFSKEAYIPFVNAFLSFGWISLGYEHNFDAMHFQAARIR